MVLVMDDGGEAQEDDAKAGLWRAWMIVHLKEKGVDSTEKLV
jgi:hypothetical protein